MLRVRILRYGLVGTVLAAAIVAVATSLDWTMANEGGASGELVVVPEVVEVGQSVEAVAFQVEPPDIHVRIEYSDHLAPEDASCAASSGGATSNAEAPTWVALKSCSAGEGYVRLVSSDGEVLQVVNVNVTVIAEAIRDGGLSGLTTGNEKVSLGSVPSTLGVGGSDVVYARASQLDKDEDYELITVPLTQRLAFNRGCTDFEDSAKFGNRTSTTVFNWVYGCDSGGVYLWAYLKVDGSAVAGADFQLVNVIAPTPTPTPRPTPTSWTDTGDTRGTCANREKKQSRKDRNGNTETRWVSAAKDCSTSWKDTGDTRGTCANREKKQSRKDRNGNTQTRWVADAVDCSTSWKDTGDTRGTCANREKKQSRKDRNGNTQTRWVADAVDCSTSWKDTGDTRGTCANREKKQSRKDRNGNTQTRWVADAVDCSTSWRDTGDTRGTCANREKKQSRKDRNGNTQTRWVADAVDCSTSWRDTGDTRGTCANREKKQSRKDRNGNTETRWVSDAEDCSTPVPTPTPTPSPPVLTGLHDRASAIDIDALKSREKIGKIYLDWSDAAGIGIIYEVEHWAKRVPLLPVYGWHPIPHGDVKMELIRARGTITGAVVSGLDYDHTYKHRVRAKRGSQYSGWVEIATKVPLPHLGHAGDHTVKYRLGAIPTPRPGATLSTDPGIVIPTAIARAVTKWNEAVATPSPHVLFCEGSGCKINGVDRNTDGRAIVINTEDGNRFDGIARVFFTVDASEHINAPTMVIEQPARQPHRDYPKSARISLTLTWNNDADLHDKDVPNTNRHRYYYLPTTVMHEFGHAAGLEDLYLLEGIPCDLLGICSYAGYIMGSAEKQKAIPNRDRDYLRDVYHNHPPHPASSGQ